MNAMKIGPRNPAFVAVADRYPHLSLEEAYKQNHRDWRKQHLLNEDNRKKNLARQSVRNAVRDGKVNWLCKIHHLEVHRG